MEEKHGKIDYESAKTSEKRIRYMVNAGFSKEFAEFYLNRYILPFENKPKTNKGNENTGETL